MAPASLWIAHLPGRLSRLISPSHSPRTNSWSMLWTLIVILVVLWLLGFSVFHVAGGLIHLLLVIAVIVLVIKLVTGRGV
jgi:hypothetical protein